MAASRYSVGIGPVPVPPERGGSSTTSSNPPASTRQRQPPSHRATTELVCALPVPPSAVTDGGNFRYASRARGRGGGDLHGPDRRDRGRRDRGRLGAPRA